MVIDQSLKGKAKSMEVNQTGRREILEIFSRAEKVVREVYVQHPNYDDIIVRFFFFSQTTGFTCSKIDLAD